MRPNVEQIFPAYSVRHEGAFLNLYVDIRGLVTCSVGVLVDPIELALRLPLMIDGRHATQVEIRADWHAVKALKERGEDLEKWTAARQAPLTKTRLTPDDSEALLRHRLAANIAYARRFFTKWDTFPADVQLALASLMWGLGAGLNKTRPELVEAVNTGDWATAKAHSSLRSDNNKGVVSRNADQDLCWDNAITAGARGLDPALLWWPRRCPTDSTLQEEAVKAMGLVNDFEHDTDPSELSPESTS